MEFIVSSTCVEQLYIYGSIVVKLHDCSRNYYITRLVDRFWPGPGQTLRPDHAVGLGTSTSLGLN